MVVDSKRGFILLFKESAVALSVLFVWDMLIVVGFELYHQSWMEQPALPIALIGSVLVLFMNFRNSSAYNRWWEARSYWGLITNNCRSLARQINSLLGPECPDLTRAVAAYAHTLFCSLRGKDALKNDNVKRVMPESIQQYIKGLHNQPNGVLYQIALGITKEANKKNLDGALQGQIDRILSDIANAQGALERIRNTPLSIQFSILPRFLAEIFCVILPLSMVQSLGWLTPLGSSLVGFLFIALDKIGSDLKDPFSDSPHALPMLTMTRNIEIDLLEQINDPTKPPIRPMNGIQW